MYIDELFTMHNKKHQLSNLLLNYDHVSPYVIVTTTMNFSEEDKT